MARPQKNNADYFSHDNDMRNDEKIKAVRRKFKHEGYSIWNMLLEKLCKSSDFTLDYSNKNIELWAGDFEIEPNELNDIINYFIKVELLICHEGMIFSETMITRFSGLLSKRKRQKEWLSTTETKKTEVIDVDNPQSKVKYSKVKQSKVKYNSIEERKREFYNSLTPFIEKFSKDILRDFFDYWAEHGEKDKKMRFEKQTSFSIERRLNTWAINEKKFSKEKSSGKKESHIEYRMEQTEELLKHNKLLYGDQ